jgi:hypothetical protein
MNISMTPLAEAWKIQKPKKNKEQNQYTSNDNQKKILKTLNLPVTDAQPSGYNNQTEYEPIIQSNKVSDSSETLEISQEELIVKISDENILEKLKPFNYAHIQKLVHQGLENVLKPSPKIEEKIESFIGSTSTNEILIYVLIGLVLLDITLKCHN